MVSQGFTRLIYANNIIIQLESLVIYMPEIPEIETLRYQLQNKVVGKKITNAVVNRAKATNVTAAKLTSVLAGQQVISARRRAKQIILSFSNYSSLVTHLMLEGYLRLFYAGEEMDRRPSLLLQFESGEQLGFFKITLGYVHLVNTDNLSEIKELADLGPEPLDPDFTVSHFRQLLAKRKGMIKPLLMDQAFMAGIGNVYSNEILFCSRIRPDRKVKDISALEQERIFDCMKDILERAVKLGGVYEEKFAADDDLTGGFEPHLQVTYRADKPCYVCGGKIVTKRVGGRNAFYCPICQS